jgi:hypothetical protein
MWLVTTGPSPANTVINQSVSGCWPAHGIRVRHGIRRRAGPVPGQQRDHHRGLRPAHAVDLPGRGVPHRAALDMGHAQPGVRSHALRSAERAWVSAPAPVSRGAAAGRISCCANSSPAANPPTRRVNSSRPRIPSISHSSPTCLDFPVCPSRK